MDYDLALVVGLVIGVFSIPSIVSAFSDRHTPRVAAITAVLAGCLIVYAVKGNPGGYTLDKIPDVLVRVVARYI